MVSIDHFAHELRTQLKRAAEQGATNILIRASGRSRPTFGCIRMRTAERETFG
jgi:hypothetical protein